MLKAPNLVTGQKTACVPWVPKFTPQTLVMCAAFRFTDKYKSLFLSGRLICQLKQSLCPVTLILVLIIANCCVVD